MVKIYENFRTSKGKYPATFNGILNLKIMHSLDQ